MDDAAANPRELPQFPLGSTLLPSMVLPLHIFEPRYRTLMSELIEFGDPTRASFGVPLIERGHEVGGDDQRTDVGTEARILQHQQLDDGRWLIVAVGTCRYRVDEWLPDDPYPRAMISDWPDRPSERDLSLELHDGIREFERCLAMAAEAGHDVGTIPDIDRDPAIGVDQLAAVAPVGQQDRQSFLRASGPDERLPLVVEAIRGAREIFEFQLQAG